VKQSDFQEVLTLRLSGSDAQNPSTILILKSEDMNDPLR